jgi:hypothetical protein
MAHIKGIDSGADKRPGDPRKLRASYNYYRIILHISHNRDFCQNGNKSGRSFNKF